jgi:tRNA dimethylallyltransferase
MTMDREVSRPVLCIVGPTATGKSELGVQIAKAVGGEVISADSMQVYRGMDIGTAKLTQEEMQGVPHHLIDLVNPDEPFSVAEWTKRADAVIEQLHREGKLPVVVGGTGLYIRAITDDLDFFDKAGSAEIRAKWQTYLEEHGNLALHAVLAQLDPRTATRLHPNDTKRVIRALELIELNQSPMSERYAWRPKSGRYHTVQFALSMDRERLYQRVNRRVDNMMEKGLYDEVQRLLDKGYGLHLSSMQAIGYKELAECIIANGNVEEAVERIKQATRRFVKRQLSWFRRDHRVRWMHKDEYGRISPADLRTVIEEAKLLAAGIPVQGLE